MNCEHVRDLLPLLAYGDLAGDERSAIESHLSQCGACRAELAALAEVRRLLDESSAPAAGADLSAILPVDTRRSRRSVQRWRVAAMAALAAAIMLAALKLEVRLDGRQLVIRWGKAEPATQVVQHSQPPVIARPEPAVSTEVAERLKVLNELVHALAANIEAGDRDRRDELAKLQKELAAIQEFDKKRWAATERDVSALYTAQFGARNSGANP